MLTAREKSPLPEKKFPPEAVEDGTHDAASSKTAIPTHYQWAIPLPPPLLPYPQLLVSLDRIAIPLDRNRGSRLTSNNINTRSSSSSSSSSGSCSSSNKNKRIIIIALKGAIRDFLQSPYCAAN